MRTRFPPHDPTSNKEIEAIVKEWDKRNLCSECGGYLWSGECECKLEQLPELSLYDISNLIWMCDHSFVSGYLATLPKDDRGTRQHEVSMKVYAKLNEFKRAEIGKLSQKEEESSVSDPPSGQHSILLPGSFLPGHWSRNPCLRFSGKQHP